MIRPGMILITKRDSRIVVTDVHVSVNLNTIITCKEILVDGYETMNGNFILSNFMETFGDLYVCQPYNLRKLKDMVVPIKYTYIPGNEKLPSG